MILAPATANAEAAPQTAEDTVSFGVFALGEERPEGSFELGDLAELGVAEADLELLAEGVVPDAEEQGANQADDVLNRWDDVEGETVIWRQGHYNPSTGRGSGAEKIDQKHNLSMEAVRTVTRWPFTNASLPDHTKTQENPPGGTSYRYQAEAWEVECTGWWWWRDCQVLDTRIVRAIVDYRVPSHSPESQGAFNAYCEQSSGDRCPDWVREALNI